MYFRCAFFSLLRWNGPSRVTWLQYPFGYSFDVVVVDIFEFSCGMKNRFGDLRTRLVLAISPCWWIGTVSPDYHAFDLMDTLYLNTAAFPHFRCLKCLKWETIEQLMEQLWPWPFLCTLCWCQFLSLPDSEFWKIDTFPTIIIINRFRGF